MVEALYTFDDLGELLDKEESVVSRFTPYCRQHNKTINTELFIKNTKQLVFILKITINEDSNNISKVRCN